MSNHRTSAFIYHSAPTVVAHSATIETREEAIQAMHDTAQYVAAASVHPEDLSRPLIVTRDHVRQAMAILDDRTYPDWDDGEEESPCVTCERFELCIASCIKGRTDWR